MSLIISTNIQSLFAQRALGRNTVSLQRSIEKLSTGSKLNRAADDAAGLSISENLNSQIRGLEKARQNAGDGISFIQTAEGSLSVVHENLQRIRELVVQAKTGTNGGAEINSIQSEINERIKSIDEIAVATKYNGNFLIKGGSDTNIQVGADDGQVLAIKLTQVDIDINSTSTNSMGESAINLNSLHLGGTTTALDGTSTSNASIDHVNTMISNVSRMRSYLGAIQNSLESRVEYLDVAIENSSSSRSRVRDVDVAKESSLMLKNQILQ